MNRPQIESSVHPGEAVPSKPGYRAWSDKNGKEPELAAVMHPDVRKPEHAASNGAGIDGQ